MVALKEFVNFINRDLAGLAANYAQVLTESDEDYEDLSLNSRKALGRKLLKAVAEACRSETPDPLLAHFDNYQDKASQNPVTEIECLGQTLIEVVPNLIAGRFLWQILLEVRTTLLKDFFLLTHSPQSDSQPQKTLPTDTKHTHTKKPLPVGEELFRQVITSISAHIYVTELTEDGQYNNVYLSPNVEEITGYPLEKFMTNRNFWPSVVIHPDDRAVAVEQSNRLDVGQHGETEYRLVKADGQIIWVRDSANVVSKENSKIIYGVISDITTRKQIEQALQTSEERNRLLIDASPDPITVYDTVGKVTYVNPSFVQTFGWTEEELIGKRINFVPEDNVAETRAVLDQLLRDEKVQGFETKRLTKDGRMLDVMQSGAIFKDKDGNSAGSMIFIRDITERKQAEETLRKSEEKYRTILEDIEDGYYEVDIAGNLTFFNDSYARILGYPADELMGMNNRQYTDEENAKILYKTFNRVYKTGESTKGAEWEVTKKDGSKAHIETSTSLITDTDGEPIGFRGIARDITERKQADEALRASEERYRLLLEASPDPIVLYDGEGRATYLNPAFTRVFGWTADELLGQRIDFVPEDSIQQTQEAIGRIFKGEDVFFETKRLIKDGNKIDVLVSASVHRDRAGNLTGMVVILRDITERKQAADNLVKALSETQALYDINQAVTTATTSTEMLAVMIKALNDNDVALNADSLTFYRLDLDKTGRPEWSEVAAWWCYDERTPTPPIGTRIYLKEMEATQAWINDPSQPVLIGDGVSDEETTEKFLRETGIWARAILPLTVAGRWVGVVRINWDKPHSFTNRDRRIYRVLMGQLANAVENKHLFEQAQQRASQLEELTNIEVALSRATTEEEILTALINGLGFEHPDRLVLQYLEVDEKDRPVRAETVVVWADGVIKKDDPDLHQWYNVDQFAMSKFWIESPNEVFLVSDVVTDPRINENIQTVLAPLRISALALLPLRSGNRWQGLIAFDWLEPHQFSTHEKFIFDQLLEPAAAIIATRRATVAQQQALTETETLYEAGSSLNAAQTYEDIIEVLRVFTLLDQAQTITIGYFDYPWTKTHKSEIAYILARWGHAKEASYSSYYYVADFPSADQFLRPDELVMIEDIATDPRMDDVTRSIYLDRFKAKSTFFAPLVVAGQWVGYVNATYGNPTTFLDTEVRQLMSLLGQATVAVQAIKQLDQTERQAHELAVLNEFAQALSVHLSVDEVLMETYRRAGWLIDTTNFYVALYDEQQDTVTFPLYIDGENINRSTEKRRIGNGLTEYVIRTRKPLLIRRNIVDKLEKLGIDTFGVRSESWLGVPLMIGQQVIGVVAVQSYTTPDTYDEQARDALTAIATQMVIALQNAHQFEETQRHARELTILNELGQALAARLKVKEMLEETYRQTARLIGTNNFHVGLYDETKDELTFITSEEGGTEITISANQNISGYIVRNQTPVLIHDGTPTWAEEHKVEVAGEPALSWLGVPLLASGQVLGVIFTQDFAIPHRFTEHDRDLLTAIANQTAVALQSARQFERIQTRARREQTIREITDKMRAAISLEELVKTTAEELGEHFSTEYALVELGVDPPETDSTQPANGREQD